MADVAYRTKASRVADEEQDIRVEDFLNDKLQNTTDLANIDSLLEDVKAQQVLLQQQLQDAKMKLDENTKASVTHSNLLHTRARHFKSQQNDVDRRLMIVTQSETSDDAIQKFDSSMESLRKLDVAQAYMELLTEVENLRFTVELEAIPISARADIFHAVLKLGETSKSLLKMLCNRTYGFKPLSMLCRMLNLLPKMLPHT